MNLALNINNGDLTFGDVKITSRLSIREIEDLKKAHKIIFVMKTVTGYSYYRSSLLNGGENSILFVFKGDKIKMISIGTGPNYNFPPFVITEEEKKVVDGMLKSLGGEHLYHWGKVFYGEDNKGGSVSISIEYENSN